MSVNPTQRLESVSIGNGNAVTAYNKPYFADTKGSNDILFSEHVLPAGARYDEVAGIVGNLRRRVESEAPGRDVMLIQIDTPRGEPERVAFVWADELKSNDPVGAGQTIQIKSKGPDGKEVLQTGRILQVSGDIESDKSFWDKCVDVISMIGYAALCVLGIYMTAEVGVLGFILFGWIPVVGAVGLASDLYTERHVDKGSKLLPGLAPPTTAVVTGRGPKGE